MKKCVGTGKVKITVESWTEYGPRRGYGNVNEGGEGYHGLSGRMEVEHIVPNRYVKEEVLRRDWSNQLIEWLRNT